MPRISLTLMPCALHTLRVGWHMTPAGKQVGAVGMLRSNWGVSFAGSRTS